MNDIKVCFINKLMTALVTLKTTAVRRVPEVVHWSGSLWLYSVWNKTMRTVLVAVQSRPKLEAGCNTPHSAGKPLLARWTTTDHIITVTDRIGTITGHIGTVTGRIGIQTTVSLSSYHVKFQQFFPLSISLPRVAYSLVCLQNVFLLIASTWLLQ